MAPYFIRNLIPHREARDDNRRPLLEVLRTITWVQWAQFVSGYAPFTLTPPLRWKA
jgi:SHS family lactate transporter-like MFS transporter